MENQGYVKMTYTILCIGMTIGKTTFFMLYLGVNLLLQQVALLALKTFQRISGHGSEYLSDAEACSEPSRPAL